MKEIEEYLNITKNDIENVRKIFGKDEISVEEDLRILNEWWKKQPHLPKNQDDTRLERMLLRNKFQIERTKVKIDNYFTLHGVYPDIFQDIINYYPDITEEFKNARVFLSPTLTDRFERIVYMSLYDKNCKPNWKKLLSGLLILHEMEISYDYNAGDRVIIDFKNVTLNHYKSVSMEGSLVFKMVNLFVDAYSARIAGIECINAPSYIDLFLQFFKVVFKPKLFSKIRVHKNITDLHSVVNPKCLPEDLGGVLKSVEFYQNYLLSKCPYYFEELKKNIEQKSDESLRIGESLTSHMFGAEGTFKKLNID